jgi:hypothetical protein
LLVVGNSIKGVEKLVARLTGGAVPVLGDVAAYQTSQQALIREAPFYGWVNVKAFADTLGRRPSATTEPDPADPLEPLKPDKLISGTGLASCRTLAFNLRDSSEGSLFQLFLSVPEATRQGLFQILAGAAKEASPPPFVPADAAQFFRWRLDGHDREDAQRPLPASPQRGEPDHGHRRRPRQTDRPRLRSEEDPARQPRRRHCHL